MGRKIGARDHIAPRWFPPAGDHEKGLENMLETIIVILIVLWLIGLVGSYTMGGALHLLLVLAIIVIVIRVLQGRRV